MSALVPGYRFAARRVVVSFAVGLLAYFPQSLMGALAIGTVVDLWVLVSFACGMFLGPAGLLGVSLAFGVTHPELWSFDLGSRSLIVIALGYAMPGLAAHLAFRRRRAFHPSLPDLPSYLAFVGATLAGSLALAVVGSTQLFARGGIGSDGFWRGVAVWTSSSVTTLLLCGPLLILSVCWLIPRWGRLLGMAKLPVGVSAPRAGASRTDLVFLSGTILAVTLVVVPLLRQGQAYTNWLLLLYLVPVLWASIRRGMQLALLAASGASIAFLAASELWRFWRMAEYVPSGHEDLMRHYTGLISLALIGAFTGALQSGRILAERQLQASKAQFEVHNVSMQAVNRLADSLHRKLDVQAIAQEACAALVRLSGAPLVGLFLRAEQSEQLELISQAGFDEETVRLGSTLPLDGSLSGKAVLEGRMVVLENLLQSTGSVRDLRQRLADVGVTRLVIVPLIFEDVALGCLNLAYRGGPRLGPETLDTLQAIGHTVALAISNARYLSQMQYQAFHDSLTGMPNRLQLHRDFADFASAEIASGQVGMALLDLDRFKEVNDALGHRAGDQLLRKLGDRLIRAGEAHGVKAYRLGGDEFSLIVPGAGGPKTTETRTRRMLAEIRRPFRVEGLALEVSASAGLSIYPGHGSDSHELLRSADVALYQAKETGRELMLYDESADQFTPERLKLASELREAIRLGQLTLHYQPKVALGQGLTVGFEGLVRWQHPAHGLLPPAAFIPLAEVGDQIHPLTDWVLKEGLSQLARWSAFSPGLSMAVNLSARSLLDATLPKKLETVIAESGLEPRRVEIELTETALLSDLRMSRRTLEAVAELGIGIAIDDFGTGYSSLALLKGLPIQAVKIDRSFVTDLASDEQSAAIVQATIQLASNLGIGVVAEGVEDRQSAELLQEMGCDLAQGFYFGHPAPPDEITL